MIKYTKAEIETFKKEKCPKCILEGKCVNESNKDEHWFAACPHFHAFKYGYTNMFQEQRIWEKAHPEEAAEIKRKDEERIKRWKEEKAKAKKK